MLWINNKSIMVHQHFVISNSASIISQERKKIHMATVELNSPIQLNSFHITA